MAQMTAPGNFISDVSLTHDVVIKEKFDWDDSLLVSLPSSFLIIVRLCSYMRVECNSLTADLS